MNGAGLKLEPNTFKLSFHKFLSNKIFYYLSDSFFFLPKRRHSRMLKTLPLRQYALRSVSCLRNINKSSTEESGKKMCTTYLALDCVVMFRIV